MNSLYLYFQDLQILSPEKDADGKLKPFKINYQETAGTTVGLVSAIQNNKRPVYSLLDVVDELPSGKSSRECVYLYICVCYTLSGKKIVRENIDQILEAG